jgi:3-hydroxymyristoyl/3-hydroxydecanoyl-(acyl carrier protein) dehydratase
MPVWHFAVSSDHPSLAGHFPGRPVVPGVVLLDEVLSRLSRTAAGPVRLLSVKFTAPVLPRQEVAVEWSELPDGRVDFICRVAERDVLRGRALLPRSP